MPLSIANRWPRQARPVPLTSALVGVFGVVSGFFLNEFGSRYPVETLLVTILLGGAATLCWAGTRILRDAARQVDKLVDDELGRRPARSDRPV